MKKFVVVLLSAAMFVFTSCEKVVGEGPLVTETRSVPQFTGISSEMSGKVNFTLASTFNVEIRAQRNILDVVRTNVVNGVLHIDFKDGVRVREHEDLTINILAPSAEYLRLSGSGNMDVIGDLVANNLQLKLSGSGNIAIQKTIIANKIDADLSGSGNISILSGSAINEALDVSGSGKIDLAGVNAENGIVKITGSGDMKVSLSKNLDANITGSGSVYYHGNPLIKTKITGSGKVVPF
ncbi:MAG TPA: head GIN domain-containing protein [Chitinophagaceae bacterium]